MIRVDRWLEKETLDARIIMQVHDELVLEVNKVDTESVVVGIERYMSGAAELTIPLEVEIGVGPNWDSLLARVFSVPCSKASKLLHCTAA